MRASECSTGDRNRTLAYLLRNFAIIDERIQDTLQQYFAQSSVLVNTRDLALIGATLGNMDQHPITQKDVLERRYIKAALSLMFNCGRYDFAGEWA